MFCANRLTTAEIYDKICDQRNIENPDEFFNPPEEWILNPWELKNMDKAVKLTLDHEDDVIGILWDTDADGITSGTEVTQQLLAMNYSVKTFINSGKAHGVLQGDRLDNILSSGIKLLIIPDSLDSSIDGYKTIHDAGIDILILDHHDVEIDYPEDILTLVSSNVDYPNPQLSGAGVALKFCMALDKTIGENYSDNLYDLAAIGILADVSDVYQSKENRAIIHKGLNNLHNPAVKKILGSYEFNAKSVLFSVAPLVNACVRTNSTNLAMDFFLETENKHLLSMKKQVQAQKEVQDEEKNRLLDTVRQQLDQQTELSFGYAIIDTELGVSGLIGNTVLDEYHKPVFILNDTGEDVFIGSMRSVKYKNFKDIVNSTGLISCKGHMESAGIELPKKNLDEFVKKLDFILKNTEPDCECSSPAEYDFEIDVSEVDRDLANMLEQINRITGNGFKSVAVKVKNITGYEVGSFKDGKHLTLSVQGTNIMVIDWNTKESFDDWELHAMCDDPFDVVCEIEHGYFGRNFTIKLIVKEFCWER